MRKTMFTLILGLAVSSSAIAGGLLTNTNQSTHFIRNPSRDASTEIDAVYTNPAGLFKMKDGFHFSFSNQSAWQTRTITSTFAPFSGYGGSDKKEYEGTASAPIIPSFQGVYKKGKWALSGSFAVSGGGGKATFSKGLPSFESTVAIVPKLLGNPAITDYSLNSYMQGSSFIYGGQLGGTYEISDMFGAYAGFRLNVVNNGYKGYLKDIKLGKGDNMFPAAAILQQAQGHPAYAALEKLLSEKELDMSQSGWGISPIIGLNFSWKNLNIGAKYEFRTRLNIENKENIPNTTQMPQFDNGVNTPHDIPALFTIGASYKIIPALSVSIGYHHFFDSEAKMASNKQNEIKGGVNEYLGGVEFQINDMFLISGGFQITRTGVKDAYQSDLSFGLNSYSVGLGGAVRVSKSVRLNLGYFWTTYSDWTKETAAYNGLPVPPPIGPIAGTDVFGRTNKVFSAGVDFSF